jgi:hypothetical protein
MKTAVHIHGYHLGAEGWEGIVWGSPKSGVLGSIPRGVIEAYKHQAALISWGTGITWNGARESETIFAFALSRIKELSELCGCSDADLETFLRERSQCDMTTVNTAEEVAAFLDRCIQEAISHVIIVACATHASRSVKTTLSALLANERFATLRSNVYFASASSTFSGSTIDDVVIIEPMHRGDMPKWQTYRYAAALFAVLKQGEIVYERFLTEFGSLLSKYGVPVDWKPRR